MLKTLTAVFEDWHLPDGNYPAFKVGDRYRLSFEVDVEAIDLAESSAAHCLTQICDAEYSSVGRVERQYSQPDSVPLAIIDIGGFRLYTTSSAITTIPVETNIRFSGSLALDHYLWVEYRHEYVDSPDLLVGVEVAGIRRVTMPERFIHRGARGLSMPTSLKPEDYQDQAPVRVRRINGEHDFGFWLLDFQLLEEPVPDLPLAFKEAA